MAAKKVAKKAKSVHIDARKTIVIGRKRRGDVLMPLRLPKDVIKGLEHRLDQFGEIRIGEEEFMAAVDGLGREIHVGGCKIEDLKIGIDFSGQALRDSQMDRINEQFIRDEQLKTDNVMTQAQAVIYGDREKTYGRPELNLESIAQLWTVYLQRKSVVKGSSDTVTINDVCQMMVLLKTARLINQPDHHDSQVDQIGYIGLQERCRTE